MTIGGIALKPETFPRQNWSGGDQPSPLFHSSSGTYNGPKVLFLKYLIDLHGVHLNGFGALTEFRLDVVVKSLIETWLP